jgi:hypothetical protein
VLKYQQDVEGRKNKRIPIAWLNKRMADIKSTINPSKDLMVHTIVGKVTADEIVDYFQKFYSSEKPTKNMIWDFTKAEGDEIPGDEIMRIANARKIFNDFRKGGKTALVFSRDVDYGLGRMYETHAKLEGSSISYNVCYSMDDALKWMET